MHEESAWVAEYELTPGQRELIRALLRESVPGYPHRSYFKQLPQFRLLLQRDDELVGQVGVEHRVIRTGDSPLRIFGVIDLCVAPTARSQGLGSRLLGEVETLARSQASTPSSSSPTTRGSIRAPATSQHRTRSAG
jgi:GNAT superfamily N-acetyltransferase